MTRLKLSKIDPKILNEINNISEEIKLEFPKFENNISLIFYSKYYHKVCAIWVSEENKVYGCGNNIQGLLGLGHNNVTKKIVQIGEKVFESRKIKNFILGNCCIFALTQDSEVYSWGWNYFGQLGNGELGENDSYYNPKKMIGLNDIKHISCGRFHYTALTNNGKVFCWGANSEGQIGIGEEREDEIFTKPYLVEIPKKVKYVYSYENCSFALSENGNIFFWGQNYWGEFDQIKTEIIFKPIELNFGNVPQLKAISCTNESIFGISEDGRYYQGFDQNEFVQIPSQPYIYHDIPHDIIKIEKIRSQL